MKVVVEPIKLMGTETGDEESSLEEIEVPSTSTGGVQHGSFILSLANNELFLYHSGGGYCGISKDCKNWESLEDWMWGSYASVHYVLGKYVSLSRCTEPGDIMTSTDGRNWTKESYKSPGVNDIWSSVRYDLHDKLFIFGDGQTKKGQIKISSDGGKSWSDHTINDCNALISGVCYGQNKLVAKDIKCNIYTSVDEGISWTKLDAKLNHIDDFWGGWNNNKLVFAYGKFWSCSASMHMEYSDDLTNWVDLGQLSPYRESISCVIFKDGKFFLVGDDMCVYIWTPPSELMKDESGIPSSSVTFKNVEEINHKQGEKIVITERTELYIEPDQLTKTSDGYEVTMDLTDIRLVSAEVTNRPYKIETTTTGTVMVPKEVQKPANISLSGTTNGTGTGKVIAEARADVKLTVDPVITLEEVGNVLYLSLGWPLFYANGQYFCFSLDKSSYSSDNRFKLNTSTDLKNWTHVSTLPFGTGGGNEVKIIEFVYFDGKYVAICSDGKCAFTSDLSRWEFPYSIPGCKNDSTFCISGNKIFCNDDKEVKVSSDGKTWESVGSFKRVYCVYAANGNIFVNNIFDIYASTNGGSTWVKKGDTSIHLKRCAYGNNEFYGIDSFLKIQKSRDGINWESVWTSNYLENVVFRNGKFYFTDANSGKICAFKDSIPEISFPELSKTHRTTNQNSITIQISASKLKDAGNNAYTLDYEIKDCRVSAAFIYPSSAKKTVIEMVKEEIIHKSVIFEGVDIPEMNRVVDFSKNPLGLGDGIVIRDKNYRMYNDATGYWETDKNGSSVDGNRRVNCGFNINNFYGDFWFLVEDIGAFFPQMRLFNRYEGPNTVGGIPCEEYYFSGLHLRYQDYFETRDLNYVSFDINNAPEESKVRYHIAGFILPINAMLYFGARGDSAHHYEWQSSGDGAINQEEIKKGPSLACQRVTADAIKELKKGRENDLRVYVIKFRKQTDFKYKYGESDKFDYGYVEACASSSEYVYEASDEVELASKLQAIAKDIQEWAGHKPAQNVE